MLHSQLTNPAFERAPRVSLAVAYTHWVGSWETALAAVATASRNRTLSTDEAAAHTAVITAERELVTKEFALLISADVLEVARPSTST